MMRRLVLVFLILLSAAGGRAGEGTISLGEEVPVYIGPDGHAERISFTAPEEGFYRFHTEGDLDTVMDCYDSDGLWLGGNDDGGEGYNASFFTYLREGAEIDISVGLYDPSSSGGARLLAGREEPVMGRMMIGDSDRKENLDPGGCVVFAMEPRESGLYTMETLCDFDSVMRIIDPEGRLVSFNDDRGDGDLSSFTTAELERGGRYFAVITGYGGDDAGVFTFSLTGPIPSEDDAPDLVEDAALEAPHRIGSSRPSAIRANFDYPGDADCFRIRFEEEGVYAFSILSELDTTLVLYDRSGRPLASNDDSGKNLNPYMRFFAREGEEVIAEARTLAPADEGRYRLTARLVPGLSRPEPIRRGLPLRGEGRVLALAFGVVDASPPSQLVDSIMDVRNFERVMIESFGADPENVRILVDDYARREDDFYPEEMEGEIRAISERAGPDDIVFIYYTGHGNGSADGPSVVYPHTASSSGLTDTRLTDLLDKLSASRIVVIVDACNSGGFAARCGAMNRWIFTASSREEGANASVENEPTRTGGSVFSAYLFDSILYDESCYSLDDCFRNAERGVRRLAPEQRPQSYIPRAFPFRGGA